MPKVTTPTPRKKLPKSPAGIQGLDEITGGGFPKGRPTLLCGTAGLPPLVRKKPSADGPK